MPSIITLTTGMGIDSLFSLLFLGLKVMPSCHSTVALRMVYGGLQTPSQVARLGVG
jgi:hypothetical protein